MADHNDTEQNNVCSCGYQWKSIWDMLNHREINFTAALPLSASASIDLFDVLRTINQMIEDGEADKAAEIIEAVAATIYTAATGDFDDMVVESYTYNLDEELKELLDGEANNDK
jgi:hypothetical protein